MSAANKLQLNDVGTTFVFTVKEKNEAGALVAVDVSAASPMKIEFLKPDRTVIERTATLNTDGLDGKVKYTTIAGDIDQAGQWEAQAKLTIAGWSGRSDRHRFSVGSNIA